VDPKPGYQTTEFYVTLGVIGAGVLALAGVIGPGEKETAAATITQGVTAMVGFVGAATVAYKFVHGRIEAKKQAADQLYPPDRPICN